MSEFELLTFFDETQDSFISMVQWWASISLALMVVAHFTGEKLRLPLVVSILVLYTSFTVMIQLLLFERAADLRLIQDELASLETLTRLGRAKSEVGGVFLWLTMMFSYWGTYIAAVAYLLWRFFQAKRQRQAGL